jgi:hypothetical protein
MRWPVLRTGHSLLRDRHSSSVKAAATGGSLNFHRISRRLLLYSPPRPLDPQICEKRQRVSVGDQFSQVNSFREHRLTPQNTLILELVGVRVGVRHAADSSQPVPDLIDPRHGQPGRFGELLAGQSNPSRIRRRSSESAAPNPSPGIRASLAVTDMPPSRTLSTAPQTFGDSRLGENVLTVWHAVNGSIPVSRTSVYAAQMRYRG